MASDRVATLRTVDNSACLSGALASMPNATLLRTHLGRALATLTLTCVPLAAMADHDDRHRHRHHHHGEYKDKYWDGQCKVERKWKKNGRYEEKRKCRPSYAYPQAAYPQPHYVAPGEPAIIISPSIVIRP